MSVSGATVDAHDVPVGRGPGDGSRAVAVGGGHGLSRCLLALTHVVDHVTAVVTAADDGGSSGRLRRELGVVPPGDLRMALTAMSPRRDLARLLQYRFDAGDMAGHSLGNLIIVAMTDLAGGDLVAALDQVAALLDVRGRVLPSTTAQVQLAARLEDGEVMTGQVKVARSHRVQRVWLEPGDAPATPQACRAIARADLVVLGPGSLFTSVLPNLLVPEIAEAVTNAPAPVVHVANLREQAGETEGLDQTAHLTALLEHVPGLRLSAIIAHSGRRPLGEGEPLQCDPETLARFAPLVLVDDLVGSVEGHEPRALAALLADVLRRDRAGTA